MRNVGEERVGNCNEAPVCPDGQFVLYWMIANRRLGWNFSLQRAVEWSIRLSKPLLIFEALRCDYPWVCERFHRFIVEGMQDNSIRLKESPAAYYPYIEPGPQAGKGLLAALSKHGCVIVTDHFPAFFLPGMVASAARHVSVRLEQVDSNGILPMVVGERAFPTAYSFRRFLHKKLPKWLPELPDPNPLRHLPETVFQKLPREIMDRWPPADLSSEGTLKKVLPVDSSVSPAPIKGGTAAAETTLKVFLNEHLESYAQFRNEPEKEVTSRLSPYLHFGHISSHQVFHEVAHKENWSPSQLAAEGRGQRRGWWGMGESAESFIDQLVTWRELGFNACYQSRDYDRYESLPAWAIQTLEEHEADEREYLYSLEHLERAQTHDSLWNASQNQLVEEGHIHNYLRMLWGKKILEWSRSPRQALEHMIELNNKYALDGRDPNSYSGILWVLGKYDRAWGPEREIFGKVRYMSSRNTARKVKVKEYIKRYLSATV